MRPFAAASSLLAELGGSGRFQNSGLQRPLCNIFGFLATETQGQGHPSQPARLAGFKMKCVTTHCQPCQSCHPSTHPSAGRGYPHCQLLFPTGPSPCRGAVRGNQLSQLGETAVAVEHGQTPDVNSNQRRATAKAPPRMIQSTHCVIRFPVGRLRSGHILVSNSHGAQAD